MPPTFAYFMILMVYMLAAAVGLAFCVFLAAFTGTRAAARRIAGGIVGSFPGVFLFQVLVLPILALAWLILWGLHQLTGDLTGVAGTTVIVVAVASTFGVFAGASLAGFIAGWGVGSRFAAGMSLSEAFERSYIRHALAKVGRRPRVAV